MTMFFTAVGVLTCTVGLMKIIIRLDEPGKGQWSGNEIGLCDKSHYWLSVRIANRIVHYEVDTILYGIYLRHEIRRALAE